MIENTLGGLCFDQKTSKTKKVYNTRTDKSRDDWETPDWLFKLLDSKYHFTVDLAASQENAKCKKFYSASNNALEKSWEGERAFCNPPFEIKSKFLKKAVLEQEKSQIIMVLPVATSPEFFHKFIMKSAELIFLEARVNYLLNKRKQKNSANFDTYIVKFEKHNHGVPVISTISKSEINKFRLTFRNHKLSIPSPKSEVM